MKRFIFGFLLLSCLAGISSGHGGGGSSSDPYYLAPAQNIALVPRASLYNFGSGYTPQNCSDSLGTKRVIVYVGQSVTANNVNSGYVVTQANNWQMDVQSGGCYTSKDPILGATISGIPNFGSYAPVVADQLISGGTAAHVITLNAAVGGTAVADWATGGYFFPSIGVIGRRLTQQGLTCTNIVWGQGENDHGTTAPNYMSRLTSVITEFRNQGMSCPFHVLVETMFGGVVDATVAGAQAAMTGTNVFVGFNMDTGVPNSGGNRYDGTHLASPGRDLAAAGVKASIAAH